MFTSYVHEGCVKQTANGRNQDESGMLPIRSNSKKTPVEIESSKSSQEKSGIKIIQVSES